MTAAIKNIKKMETLISKGTATGLASGQEPVGDDDWTAYNTNVGIARYIAEDRFDIQYAIMRLSEQVRTPTREQPYG